MLGSNGQPDDRRAEDAVSWTNCLPSSMEPASGNTTVTASSVTDSSSWRVAACSAVWSAMSSVLTSSSLAAS